MVWFDHIPLWCSLFILNFCGLAEYGEKIDACKKKTEAVRSEVAGDVDIDQLEKELQEELEKEQLLMEDLR